MAPTDQQKAIYENVAAGSGHTVVIARAGTGKTTTALQALEYVPDGASVLFVAFGKIIADELRARAPRRRDLRVSTCHALGKSIIHRALGDVLVDTKRTAKLVKRYARDAAEAYELRKLVSLAKNSLASTEPQFEELVLEHGLDYGEDIQRFVRSAMAVWNACADKRESFDFDDMIWWPYEFELEHPQYDYVFVDELQDLNAAQVEMVLKCGKRIICLGDPAQCIYHFRGAGLDNINLICARLGATQLPLTITRRCGKAIVAEAQRFVPDIQAPDDAHDGIVRGADLDEMIEQAALGDFILSRTNAPLVPLVWRLRRAGKDAIIRGRAIGENLASIIRRQNARNGAELRERLDAWAAQETQRLLEQDPPMETAAAILADKVSCIQQLIVDPHESAKVIAVRAQEMFDDDVAGRVILSTTHKAKGLEADRVWVLRNTYLQRRRGAVSQEERNLMYVAITRARNELIYVTS